MTDDEAIEQELKAKGLTAPRITPEHIEELIIEAAYWQPEGTTLTVCALKLRNGTVVVGESACVSPKNFDLELGRKLAREDATRKIWPLEGYLLKESLAHD